MLRQPTLDLLHELRLSGMAQAFEEQAAMPDISELSFDDRLSLLLEREKTEREQRRYMRLKGLAKLHLDAAIEDITFNLQLPPLAPSRVGTASQPRKGWPPAVLAARVGAVSIPAISAATAPSTPPP